MRSLAIHTITFLFILPFCVLTNTAIAQDTLFAAAVNYGTADGPFAVFAVDLDGDEDIDLAVLNRGSHNISVFFNNGDGTFQTPVNYLAGYLPNWICAADFNNDENNDLAVANQGDNVLVLLNNGDGTFQPAVAYGTGYWPQGIFSTDVDNDSDYDLAVANSNSNNVSILINQTTTSNIDNSSLMFSPGDSYLSQNYPNPFEKATSIKYQIPESCIVTLKVCDVLGNNLETLVNEKLSPGEHEVEFSVPNGQASCNGRLTSGIYYYQLKAGKYTETKKMILLR